MPNNLGINEGDKFREFGFNTVFCILHIRDKERPKAINDLIKEVNNI